MPEFLQLPREDQREALLVAAERSGRPLHLLEKDAWVVWALHHFFTEPSTKRAIGLGRPGLPIATLGASVYC